MRRFGRIPNGGYSAAQVKAVYSRFGVDDSFITGKEVREDAVTEVAESSFAVTSLSGEYKALIDKILKVEVKPKDDEIAKEPIKFLDSLNVTNTVVDMIEPTKEPVYDLVKTFFTLKDSLGGQWGKSPTYLYKNVNKKTRAVIIATINDSLNASKIGFNTGEEFYLFFNYSSRDSIIEVPVMFVGVNTASTDAQIEIKELKL